MFKNSPAKHYQNNKKDCKKSLSKISKSFQRKKKKKRVTRYKSLPEDEKPKTGWLWEKKTN